MVKYEDENPRMPLTGKGILYLLVIVAAAIGTAYLIITGFEILDDDNQYAVTIGLIVLFVGILFCRDSIWTGFGKRAIWSFVFALIVSLLIVANGLFFEHFFSV